MLAPFRSWEGWARHCHLVIGAGYASVLRSSSGSKQFTSSAVGGRGGGSRFGFAVGMADDPAYASASEEADSLDRSVAQCWLNGPRRQRSFFAGGFVLRGRGLSASQADLGAMRSPRVWSSSIRVIHLVPDANGISVIPVWPGLRHNFKRAVMVYWRR
ncbi:hypothetical protein C8J57DRAFT_118625 [Mycena rebaudengoi]|nr:hypothetical protein C8J57DRAFT_118625 [Mycena rebaudengoi]